MQAPANTVNRQVTRRPGGNRGRLRKAISDAGTWEECLTLFGSMPSASRGVSTMLPFGHTTFRTNEIFFLALLSCIGRGGLLFRECGRLDFLSWAWSPQEVVEKCVPVAIGREMPMCQQERPRNTMAMVCSSPHRSFRAHARRLDASPSSPPASCLAAALPILQRAAVWW
ncbi:hypothetical protein BS50DRAFT_231309 [Corynespora cassiicola Philippines]|uniref:Uncharacterized protein n=1 Tax=Corynespora cassiicola Philippines TaxID=1448308 RepID=A0A2T2N1X5_CORCC|nr:hypothetical protein BS50DRAFT_231309 [Corynespora cassiicola Philippines]